MPKDILQVGPLQRGWFKGIVILDQTLGRPVVFDAPGLDERVEYQKGDVLLCLTRGTLPASTSP